MRVIILDIDDEFNFEALFTQYFRLQWQKGGYEFIFICNEARSLRNLLNTHDFNAILNDINTPRIDISTLLLRIGKLKNIVVRCIIVSVLGGMNNILSLIDKEDNIITQPVNMEDFSLTIDEKEQILFIRELQQEQSLFRTIKNDLAFAGKIQQAILPQVFPPFPDLVNMVDIYASMVPAKGVGGDFYDFFRIDKNRIGLVIADVSGNGISASLFMAVSRTQLRTTALRGISSGKCLAYVNELLCKENQISMFVTVFYGIYDCWTGTIEYTNAGHNPLYILRQDGRVESLPVAVNFVVGAFENLAFESAMLQLETGDTLVMYTDGITEAFNKQRVQFSEKRLKNVLGNMQKRATAKDIVNNILESVKEFVGNYPQSDDITLLSIQRKE